jgi:uncharacterized membrane protein YfcA
VDGLGTGTPVALAAFGLAAGIGITAIGPGGVLSGTIHWPLVAVVGVPELAGVLIGHRIAHGVSARWLTYALGIALVALAPWLLLRG